MKPFQALHKNYRFGIYMAVFTTLIAILMCAALVGCSITFVGSGENTAQSSQPTSSASTSQTITTTTKPQSTVNELHGVWDGALLLSFDSSWNVMWTPQYLRSYSDNGNGTITIKDSAGNVNETYGFDVDGDTLTLTDFSGGQCICKRVRESLISPKSDMESTKGIWAYLSKTTDGKNQWNIVSLEMPSSGSLQYLGTAPAGGEYAAKSKTTAYSLRYIGGVFRLRLDSCAVLTFDKTSGVMSLYGESTSTDIPAGFKMHLLSPNTQLSAAQITGLLRELETKLGITA